MGRARFVWVPFQSRFEKGCARIMRKRLKIAFMLTASTAIATSSSLTIPLWASEGDRASEAITTTDEHGRKIYVNESVPEPKHATQAAQPRQSVEASTFCGYGVHAGGAVGGGGSQPVLHP